WTNPIRLFFGLLFSRFDQPERFITLFYNLVIQPIIASIPSGPGLFDSVYSSLVANLSENNQRIVDFPVYAAALLGQCGLVVPAPPIWFQVLAGPEPVVFLEQLDELHCTATEVDLSPHLYYVFLQLHKIAVCE